MAKQADAACAVGSAAADGAPSDELFDLAAHDIKNALNVVNSALDLIAEDPGEVPDMLPLLRRSSGRIARLVATLVEVQRLVAGTMPVSLEEAPWETLRDAALGELAALAQAKGVTVDATGESLVVRCDRALLQRVVTNLLDHALAASPRGATVDLHAERTANGPFRLRVGNRGAAVPAELLPALLDPGDDDEVAARQLGGFGLGIVFCRLAVRRQGGSIRAVSPYDGDLGLAFEIELS